MKKNCSLKQHVIISRSLISNHFSMLCLLSPIASVRYLCKCVYSRFWMYYFPVSSVDSARCKQMESQMFSIQYYSVWKWIEAKLCLPMSFDFSCFFSLCAWVFNRVCLLFVFFFFVMLNFIHISHIEKKWSTAKR